MTNVILRNPGDFSTESLGALRVTILYFIQERKKMERRITSFMLVSK